MPSLYERTSVYYTWKENKRTMSSETERPPLGDAPQDLPPPPEAKPSVYRAEFLIETAEGYHVLVVGEQLTPRDVFVWVKNASTALAQQGFKPVRRDSSVAVTVAGGSGGQAAQGQGGAGDATAIAPTQIGDIPKCSIHGDMKHVTGVYKADHARAGQSYAFWGCSNRACKVTWRPAAAAA